MENRARGGARHHRARLADRADQSRRQLYDHDRCHDDGLAVAAGLGLRFARLQPLHAADAVLRRRRLRRGADRGCAGWRRRPRRRARRRPPRLLARPAPGAAVLGAAVERGSHIARDRRAAGARASGWALHARPAMGAAADAGFQRGARRVCGAGPHPADARRHLDRGRLQRAVELRDRARPFRLSQARGPGLGAVDDPFAARHDRRARFLCSAGPASPCRAAVLAALGVRSQGARRNLAARRADRTFDRRRSGRLRRDGVGDGAHRPGIGRGARDRHPDRRHGLHGPAGTGPGRRASESAMLSARAIPSGWRARAGRRSPSSSPSSHCRLR